MFLNFVFVVHAAIALLGAFLLVFAPGWVTEHATAVPWLTGPITDVAADYAVLTAAGALLIALVTALACLSPSAGARQAGLRAMVLLSLFAAALAFVFVSFQPLKDLLLVFNVAFAVIYTLIELFMPEQILGQ